MKKRILFVGQDQTLRQQFEAGAKDPASNWTVEFAGAGFEALEIADRARIDAAVVDVELTGMGGVDLLDQIMRRRPKAIRMILSDVADIRNTVQCVGRAHHHLFKPCDAATIINALNHALTLEASQPSETVRVLVAQMRWVPSPPAVYARILSELQSPDAAVDRVGGLLAEDPALTAKLLQLANSAVFGLRMEVTHPTDALAYIGMETTRALVLLAHTFSSFDQLHRVGFSAEALWQHSLLTGQLARKFAEIEKAGQEMSEQSFSAGLLHDLGKLLFAANLPGPFGQALALARSQNLSLCEAEQRVLGASHPELGACVLGIWALPMSIVEAVALHHHPSQCLNHYAFSPLTAVHVANALQHEPRGRPPSASSGALDLDYVKRLGLEHRIDRWKKAAGIGTPTLN